MIEDRSHPITDHDARATFTNPRTSRRAPSADLNQTWAWTWPDGRQALLSRPPRLAVADETTAPWPCRAETRAPSQDTQAYCICALARALPT
ncbi:hypothetical protein [Streptomyces spectabilis]